MQREILKEMETAGPIPCTPEGEARILRTVLSALPGQIDKFIQRGVIHATR